MKNKTLRVVEIFQSIQGEGYNAGKNVIFIRLAGCNLSCPFCDTNHVTYTEMTLEEIVVQVRVFNRGVPTLPIVWTGGEPTLQLNKGVIMYFLENGLDIHWLESNGVWPDDAQWLGLMKYITISPKNLHDLHVSEAYEQWVNVYVSEIRIPIDTTTETSYIYILLNTLYAYRFSNNISTTMRVYLSPIFNPDNTPNPDNIKKAIEIQRSLPAARISLQIHKLIGIA